MNAGDNYKNDCSYKIWLYAGNPPSIKILTAFDGAEVTILEG